MKRNKLIEAMGKIEDRFILEADEEVSSKKAKIFSFGEGKKWMPCKPFRALEDISS